MKQPVVQKTLDTVSLSFHGNVTNVEAYSFMKPKPAEWHEFGIKQGLTAHQS